MAHFTVAVISRDGDYNKVLAPYAQDLMCAPYVDVYKEDFIADMREEHPDLYPASVSDEEVYRNSLDPTRDTNIRGDLTSSFNDSARWDWYQLGGRWMDSLLIKDSVSEYETGAPGTFDNPNEQTIPGYKWVDSAKLEDVEFDTMVELDKLKYSDRYEREWEVAVDGSPLALGEERIGYGMKSYYEDNYGTKENFVNEHLKFRTNSLVLEEGGWYSSSQEDYDYTDHEGRFITNYEDALVSLIKDPHYQGWYISIVDCHV